MAYGNQRANETRETSGSQQPNSYRQNSINSNGNGTRQESGFQQSTSANGSSGNPNGSNHITYRTRQTDSNQQQTHGSSGNPNGSNHGINRTRRTESYQQQSADAQVYAPWQPLGNQYRPTRFVDLIATNGDGDWPRSERSTQPNGYNNEQPVYSAQRFSPQQSLRQMTPRTSQGSRTSRSQ